MILNSVRKRVSLKVTGQILPDREGGGTISFIDRTVRRWPHQSLVEVFVKASYLDSCFDAYQVRTGSTTMPNIANTLEQSSSSPPLWETPVVLSDSTGSETPDWIDQHSASLTITGNGGGTTFTAEVPERG